MPMLVSRRDITTLAALREAVARLSTEAKMAGCNEKDVYLMRPLALSLHETALTDGSTVFDISTTIMSD